MSRTLFDIDQNYEQQQCLENRSADCPNREHYDRYRQQRDVVLKEKR